MTNEISRIFEAEARAVLNIPVTDSFHKACDLIHEAVHKNKGKVVASGMGKAGQIALNIATTFSATGTPAVFLHPSDAQHGDLGVIQPNDILLLVSNSGKTLEILELCELAQRLGYRMKTIVITGNPDSDLGRLADVTISTGHPQEVCPLGTYSHNLNNGNDSYWRCPGCITDEKNWFFCGRLCQKTSRRVPRCKIKARCSKRINRYRDARFCVFYVIIILIPAKRLSCLI